MALNKITADYQEKLQREAAEARQKYLHEEPRLKAEVTEKKSKEQKVTSIMGFKTYDDKSVNREKQVLKEAKKNLSERDKEIAKEEKKYKKARKDISESSERTATKILNALSKNPLPKKMSYRTSKHKQPTYKVKIGEKRNDNPYFNEEWRNERKEVMDWFS